MAASDARKSISGQSCPFNGIETAISNLRFPRPLGPLEINRSYEPRSRAEEFTVFRMAQVFWLLRRLDSAENAVYDSLAEMANSATRAPPMPARPQPSS